MFLLSHEGQVQNAGESESFHRKIQRTKKVDQMSVVGIVGRILQSNWAHPERIEKERGGDSRECYFAVHGAEQVSGEEM